MTLNGTAITASGLASLAELPAFAYVASPQRAAEELVRRIERGAYQAVDDMLSTGLFFPGRGRFASPRLEVLAAGEKERTPLVCRYHLELHWVFEPDKIDQTFFADFKVDRGAVFLSETGIREKAETPAGQKK